MGRYTQPTNGLARPPNGLTGSTSFSLFDLLGQVRDVFFSIPEIFARPLFARILHRFYRPWSFRDCPLPSLISSQVQQFLTPTQSLISLLTFIYSHGPLCQNSSSLLCSNSKSIPLHNPQALRKNLHLRNPCFAILHLFAGTAIFCIFTSSQSLNSLQLDLFARTYLFAINDLFAKTALRNSLLLRST